jgi:hypothetical protein
MGKPWRSSVLPPELDETDAPTPAPVATADDLRVGDDGERDVLGPRSSSAHRRAVPSQALRRRRVVAEVGQTTGPLGSAMAAWTASSTGIRSPQLSRDDSRSRRQARRRADRAASSPSVVTTTDMPMCETSAKAKAIVDADVEDAVARLHPPGGRLDRPGGLAAGELALTR